LPIVSACSNGGSSTAPRNDYLDKSVQGIIKDGLSEKPSAEFRKARDKVDGSLGTSTRKDLGRIDFSSTTGKELVRDSDIDSARKSAAKVLGTKLDPKKVSDALSASAMLTTMFDQLSSNFDGVTSCEELDDDKVVDCVVTLLIAEVKRTEQGEDGDEEDAGSDESDQDAGTTLDAGSADAGRDGSMVSPDATAATPLWNCDTRDVSSATHVTAVTGDQTWRGLMLLSGSVRVTNAKLTIEAGTVILMESGAMLDIGYNGAAAGIYANGTADSPIRLCGRNATPGYWNALVLEATASPDSVLSHILLSDGGSSNASLVLNGPAIVDNVQVRNSGKDGIWAADFAANSANLTVEGSKAAAAVLTARAAVSSFPTGSTLTGNTDDSVHLNFLNFDQSATLRNLGVPYIADQGTRVTGGTLTIEAGVQYKVKPASWFEVGYNSTVATIQVNGTAAEPVVFSGVSAQPGGWNGLYINATTANTSTLSYVRILHGGANTSYPAALTLNNAITVDHVTVDQSAYGVLVAATGFGASSKNLTVTGLTDPSRRPLVLLPDALGTIPTGSSFIGNATNQIEIQAGNFTKIATVAKFDVPYYIAGNLRTMANSQLTLAPGTEFIASGGIWVEIGYNSASGARLTAEGTADAPIRFSGLDPVAGSWKGLYLDPNVASTSSLRYVEIAHAGGDTSYPASIYLEVAIPIDHCTIHDGRGFGISKRVANATDYASMNTFTNLAMGAVTTH
jgi:hypothetical protein